jgi:YhcH/YjgK/YiaL family protein
MIIDKISNHSLYHAVHPLFSKAFKYLTTTDFTDYEPGKYPIDGNDAFVLVNDYLTKSDGQLEGHHEYIDIQYVISGSEKIGYAPLNGQKESIPYNAEKDIAFYLGDKSDVTIETGMFAVFFPGDLHLPGLKTDKSAPVKKIVVKLKVKP